MINRSLPYMLVLFLLHIYIAAAHPIWEDITETRDRRKFYAIVLRDLGSRYVIATGKGIGIIDRASVLRNHGVLPEAKAVDELLTSANSWITKSMFDQSEEELPRIDEAIKAFKRACAPKLSSSVAPKDFKTAIGYAFKYYQDERDMIEPTIKAFKVSRQIMALSEKVAGGKSYTNDTLLRLIKARSELSSIKSATPLAKRERATASRTIGKQIKTCEQALASKAISRAKENWGISEVTNLMKTIRSCAEIDPAYSKQQALLTKPLIDAAGEYSKTLPAVALSMFSFNHGPQIDLKKLHDARSWLRSINNALDLLANWTFGPEKKQLAAQLRARVAANDKDMAAAGKVRDDLQALSASYLHTQTLFQTSKYDEATKTVAKVRAQAKRLKVLSEPFAKDLTEFETRIHGAKLMFSLRSDKPLGIGEIEKLIKDSRVYVAKNADKFKKFHLSKREFDRHLKAHDRYLTLKKHLKQLETSEGVPAKVSWARIESVRKMLADPKNPMHPAAAKTVSDFMAADGEKIRKAAVAELKNKAFDFDKKADVDVLLALVDYALERGEIDAAVKLADVVYKQLPDKNERDPVIAQLLKRNVRASRILAQKGKHAESGAVLDRLKKRFPNYVADSGLDENILDSLMYRVTALRAANKEKEAVEILEKVCRDGPDYAYRKELFGLLMDLKVKTDSKLDADQDYRRQFLENYSKEFKHRISKCDPVVAERDLICKDFETTWAANDPVGAVETFLALAAKYPEMTKQTHAVRAICAIVQKKCLPYKLKITASRKENEDATGALVVIPRRVLKALDMLLKSPHEDEVRSYKLHVSYVEFQIAEARRLMAVGSMEQAFLVLGRILSRYPGASADNQVRQLMESKRRELWFARFRKPLRIRYTEKWYFGLSAMWIDLGALGFSLLFWFVAFLNAIKNGKRYGHFKYSLWHYLTTILLFMGLMVVFLGVGQFYHFPAVLISFAAPAILLNGLAQFSYVFFPLIYVRRQLDAKRLLLNSIRKLPGMKERLPALARNIEQLERDLPLLHDRWLFRIERAIRQSATDPERAFKVLLKIQQKLDKELVKNDAWKAHHDNCIFHLGRISRDLGRLDDAEKYLQAHLEVDPRGAETHELLAQLCFDRFNYERAIPHLKVALAAKGNDDEMWYCLGRCFFETGKFKSAYKCFETIKEPTRDSIFYNARAYARVGNHKRSVEAFQSLLRQNSEDGEVIYFLASSFAQLDEDVKAFKIISVIKEDNLYYPHALSLQGAILLRNGKKEKAASFYRDALEMEPCLAPALYGQGQIYLETGDIESAASCFSQLLETEPDHAAGNYYCGITQYRLGRPATQYFERAMEDKHFLRPAATQAGRQLFFEKDYAGCIRFLKAATDAGENSPWSLYLYAFALACEKDLGECQRILIQLFGHGMADAEWREQAPNAMYSIGYKLFSQGDYHMASQCFEFVVENIPPGVDTTKLYELIGETRFRMIMDLIRNNHYGEAKGVVAELQLSTADPKRLAVCQFYLALCEMYERNYEAALRVLQPLVEEHPDDARYLYHLVVCELGVKNDKAAADRMAQLREIESIPAHIEVGMAMVRAHLLAIIDNISEGEQVLAEVMPKLTPELPGNTYIRRKVMLARTDYLCRIHDSTRLQFILAEMDQETKGHAAYLQALATLEGGNIGTAVKNLQPFANDSRENVKLFSALSAALAADLIKDGNRSRAAKVLAQVPNSAPAVKNALIALQMGEVLTDTGTVDGVNSALDFLESTLQENSNAMLGHTIIHNMLILRFMRAMYVESTREKANIEELWQEFWQFWDANIANNAEFWNQCLVRINPDGSKPFAKKEIELLNATFRRETLLEVFIGYTIAYLGESGQTDLNRHINYIVELGTADDQLETYMTLLGKKSKEYVDSREKGDPLLKTWDFVIGYLQIQVAVRQITRPNDCEGIRKQLNTYTEYRNHYASPNDYMQAKKTFNTKLLDALQRGIEGKFTKAGDQTEKCLLNVPHGINLENLADALWKLRDISRRPGDANEKGINLSQEYERMYQRVLNFSLQKGT